MIPGKLLLRAAVVTGAVSLATAFSFTATGNTQCGALTVTWKGGQAPFSLLIVPIYGTPKNVSVPASAFANNQGSFQTQLPFAQGVQYLLSMSDATGSGTGGASQLMKVDAPNTGDTCNSTMPSVDFFYDTNSALSQCLPYSFTNYPSAQLPIMITGFVPGGTTFEVVAPITATSYDWTANIASGTSVVFIVTDAAYRQGGSSDVLTVLSSGSSSCLSGSSPSSTAISISTSTTATATKSKASSTGTKSSKASATASQSSSSGAPIAAIAGSVIGALIALAVMVTLGLFFLRKRLGPSPYGSNNRKSQRLDSVDALNKPNNGPAYGGSPYGVGGQGYNGHGYGGQGFESSANPFEMAPNQHVSQSEYAASQYSATARTPFTAASSQQQFMRPPSSYSDQDPYSGMVSPFGGPNPTTPHARQDSHPSTIIDPFYPQYDAVSAQGTTTSAAQRKAAMAGETNYQPRRFILHTDVDEEIQPNADGVVELPPQYSERRAPIAGLQSSAAPSGSQQSTPSPLQEPPYAPS